MIKYHIHTAMSNNHKDEKTDGNDNTTTNNNANNMNFKKTHTHTLTISAVEYRRYTVE